MGGKQPKRKSIIATQHNCFAIAPFLPQMTQREYSIVVN
jgi:hypothetical protein